MGAVRVFSVIPPNPEWQSKSHSHSQMQRAGPKECLAQGHPASEWPGSLTCPDSLARAQHRPQCPMLSHCQSSAEGLCRGGSPREVLTLCTWLRLQGQCRQGMYLNGSHLRAPFPFSSLPFFPSFPGGLASGVRPGGSYRERGPLGLGRSSAGPALEGI